jgi:hypothetical protein
MVEDEFSPDEKGAVPAGPSEEPLYPKLSPERRRAFLDGFLAAVKAGAVKLEPGNEVFSPEEEEKER